jgi:tripartite-type tricarboxylate transporter receptor subunit TctC
LAPALTDLIGGQVQAIFSTTPPAIEHIRAGKLRALGVTSATRSEALPELPTIGDFLPGYEATFIVGLGAPKNVPAVPITVIGAGKLRALGVTSATRSEALPELPTIGDFLPGYEATFIVGLGAPKNVPAVPITVIAFGLVEQMGRIESCVSAKFVETDKLNSSRDILDRP